MATQRVNFFNNLGAYNDISNFVNQLNKFGGNVTMDMAISDIIARANEIYDLSPDVWANFISSLTFNYNTNNWTTSPATLDELNSFAVQNNVVPQGTNLRTAGNWWDVIGSLLGGNTSSSTTVTGDNKAGQTASIIAIVVIAIVAAIGLYYVVK